MNKKATLMAAIDQAFLAKKEACANLLAAHSRFEDGLQKSQCAFRGFKFDGTCTLEEMNASIKCADILLEETQILGRIFKEKDATYFVARKNLRDLEKMEVSL